MRRALLIGCQTDGLVGVHADLEAMAQLAERYAFADITVLCDEAADRAGILAGIDYLIARTSKDDAVLLYYSGHGWWVDVPPAGTGAPRHYQGISPWDLRASTADDFRGILAAELSTRLALLTARTTNVSVVLDCCHATGAVRGVRPVPGARGLAVPWTIGVERCLAQLDELGVPLALRDPECNPHAVRLLACSPRQRAFEAQGESRGGLLTRALVAELAACDHGEVVWEDLARRVLAHVRARQDAQHPVVLGPARRFLFRSDTRNTFGTTGLLHAGGRHYLVGGAMTGMQMGDRFAVLPLANPSRGTAQRGAAVEPLLGALAHLEIGAVEGHLAELPGVAAELPAGASARPTGWAHPRASVTLALRDAWRPAAAAAWTQSGQLRIANAGEPALASVVEQPGGLVALDPDGLPLTTPWAVHDDAALDAALFGLGVQLAGLARADELRRLTSPMPLDPQLQPFELEWWTVDTTHQRLVANTQVRASTRVTVRAHNPGGTSLYVAVLLAGPGAQVRLLSRSQPTGAELSPGDTYWLGEPGLTGVHGVRLGWPSSLPATAPCRATLVAVISDVAVDLRAWETAAADQQRNPADAGSPALAEQRAARFTVVSLAIEVDPAAPRR